MEQLPNINQMPLEVIWRECYRLQYLIKKEADELKQHNNMDRKYRMFSFMDDIIICNLEFRLKKLTVYKMFLYNLSIPKAENISETTTFKKYLKVLKIDNILYQSETFIKTKKT